jgi:uncharacterized protein YjlB
LHKLTVAGALKTLGVGADNYAVLLNAADLDVGFYKPTGFDSQTPHVRDELYVIAAGKGEFICGGETETFCPGDAFFVPGGMAHRFLNFSDDFSTWVVFFGTVRAT